MAPIHSCEPMKDPSLSPISTRHSCISLLYKTQLFYIRYTSWNDLLIFDKIPWCFFRFRDAKWEQSVISNTLVHYYYTRA
jgi:hypothetical protein